jgi:hypothetical protein
MLRPVGQGVWLRFVIVLVIAALFALFIWYPSMSGDGLAPSDAARLRIGPDLGSDVRDDGQ